MTLKVYSVRIEIEAIVVAESERDAIRTARDNLDAEEDATAIDDVEALSAQALDRAPDALSMVCPRGVEDLTVRDWIACAEDDTKIHNAVFMSKQQDMFARRR